MIKIYLWGIRINICFSFLFIAALTTLYSCNTAVLTFAACILHELGHAVVMKHYGIRIKSVTFYGAGIKITPHKGAIISAKGEAAVLLGGCAVNLLLFVIFGRSSFGVINLFLCGFNMLPAGGLDGGRLLRLILDEQPSVSGRAALSVCRLTGCTAAVILPTAAFFFGSVNPTVLTAAAFMLITALWDKY